jgi:hypothetical protein
MKELEKLTDKELMKEYIAAHQRYMEASADFHIYLPKTRRHLEAAEYLDKVLTEINRRRGKKQLFS